MISVKVADQDEAKSWNEFVKGDLYSTPYHIWEYGESLSSTYSYERFYFAAKEDEEIVGIFPLVRVKSLLFGDRLISMPFCEYGGPISSSENVKKLLLEVAVRVANRLNVDYIEIRNPPDNASNLKNEYSALQRYITFRIDLTKPTETLWRNLDKKTRNAVRKAVKKSVEVRECESRDLEIYFELYLKTQKRHGSPPNSFKLFQKLFQLLQPMGIMRVLLATYQGKTIAGIITFQINGVIYWWGNVTELEYRRLNATNLLLWKVLEWGCENGFKTVDLGRTRRYTPIYHFKSGWGGKETDLRDYVCFLGDGNIRLPDPEQSKYRFLSRIWSIMPMFFAKRIGPKIVSGVGL
jgi:FemAB-related protein (PEP-CTERM system-associated)